MARALNEHPGLPLILLGHSMGSFAVQQYLLDHSADVDAVARTDFDWLSRDEAVVDAYVADPRCGFGIDAESAKALFVGARRLADPAQLAALRASLPVYIAVGESDPVNGGLTLG
jgi:alpha-beta hydrolase superfamily lysophospholipase